MDPMRDALREKRSKGLDLMITITPVGADAEVAPAAPQAEALAPEQMAPGAQPVAQQQPDDAEAQKLGLAPGAPGSEDGLPEGVSEVGAALKDQPSKGIGAKAKKFWADKKGQKK